MYTHIKNRHKFMGLVAR